MDQRDANPTAPWRIEGEEVRTRAEGGLKISPSLVPLQNLLFHDGTNLSIENQMAELAKTGISHDLAAQLLRVQFEVLRRAVRGQA